MFSKGGEGGRWELFFFFFVSLRTLNAERDSIDTLEWSLKKVGTGGTGSLSEGWAGSVVCPSDARRLALLVRLRRLEKRFKEDFDFLSSAELEDEPLPKGMRSESPSSMDLLLWSGMLSVLWDSDGRL